MHNLDLDCKSPPTEEERDPFKKQISRKRAGGRETTGRGENGIMGWSGVGGTEMRIRRVLKVIVASSL